MFLSQRKKEMSRLLFAYFLDAQMPFVFRRPGWTRPGFELTAATFPRIPGVFTAGLLVITELRISVTRSTHA